MSAIATKINAHSDKAAEVTEYAIIAAAENAICDYMTGHGLETRMIDQCGHYGVEQYASAIVEDIVCDLDHEGRFDGLDADDARAWRLAAFDITARAGIALAHIEAKRKDATEIIECEHCADANERENDPRGAVNPLPAR